MAFGSSIYAGGSFSSNCLDDVPFRLSPRFNPPNKVILPPDLNLYCSSKSKALNEEYSFEVEKAVLKWSADKQKQDEIKREKTIKRQTIRREAKKSCSEQEETSDNTDGPIYENQESVLSDSVYENAGAIYPKPVPKPRPPRPNSNYANVVVPNSLIANISNDILTPMPTSDTKKQTTVTKSKSSDFDLAWFEKEDDPFEQLERETINDLEELASVLSKSSKVQQSQPPFDSDKNESEYEICTVDGGESSDFNIHNGVAAEFPSDAPTELEHDDGSTDDTDSDDPIYENVELKQVGLKISQSEPSIKHAKETDKKEVLDIRKLPPVPPRPGLGSRGVLPPIGSRSSDSINSDSKATTSDKALSQSTVCNGIYGVVSDVILSSTNPFQMDNNLDSTTPKSVISKPQPNVTRSSQHMPEPASESNKNLEPSVSIRQQSNNPFSVQFTNPSSTAGLVTASISAHSSAGPSPEMTFVSSHFGGDTPPVVQSAGKERPTPAPKPVRSPPPVPSVKQAWNRYSPLPTPDGNAGRSGPQLRVALPGLAKPTSPDAYSKLTPEARASVDHLVNMGFSKDRILRAVQALGSDEKEVVEYLCLVDQLVEKGYNISLAETALLIFQNKLMEASTYLELFTQLRELGFNGEKIKEALVHTNNDREKTLDILTASS